MAVLLSVNSRNYVADRREFQAPQALDASVSVIKIRLTRESWPLGNPIIEAAFEISLDGGVNWIFLGAMTFAGGVVLQKGVAMPEASFTLMPIPGVGQAGRLIRGVVENFQNLSTAITIEAF